MWLHNQGDADAWRYDHAGRLVHSEHVKGLHSVKSMVVTPKKECLIFGNLKFSSANKDLRLGEFWASGKQNGVLKVTLLSKKWSISRFTLFGSSMWGTPKGVWIYRQKLTPHSFYSLTQEQKSARHTFNDYRNRLYFYSFDGKLQRSLNQTNITCAKSGTNHTTKGLITKQYLGGGRCGTIYKLLLPEKQ
ncbi:MAG: hypothetical protein KAI47_25155 [Deltaproteobacteria bacterium]|nr:hypothetical protein [Deltaproteobacteria bacterium]